MTAGSQFGKAAGFFGRAFIREQTRAIGPALFDGRRALRHQIRGMQDAAKNRAAMPKSSHETFSVAAFGGDFTRMSDTVETTQKELLDVTKEMLAFIKENRVVFG